MGSRVDQAINDTAIARLVVQELPEKATVTRKCAGMVSVTFLQNCHGQLLAAPFAMCTIVGAPAHSSRLPVVRHQRARRGACGSGPQCRQDRR